MPDPGAAAAHLDQVLLERFEVAVAQRARVAQQVRQLFHALEARRAGERERQFVVVQDVEDEDVVPAVPEHLQALEQRLAVARAGRRRSATRPRLGIALGDAAAGSCRMSVFSRGLLTCSALHDGVDVRLRAARRDDLPHVLVEGDQPARVLLLGRQVRQAGGGGAGVVVLVQRAGFAVPVDRRSASTR